MGILRNSARLSLLNASIRSNILSKAASDDTTRVNLFCVDNDEEAIEVVMDHFDESQQQGQRRFDDDDFLNCRLDDRLKTPERIRHNDCQGNKEENQLED